MGALAVPPYEYRPARGVCPEFMQPPEVPREFWVLAVIEVMRDCPVPYGLYDSPEPWVRRPNPGKPETHWFLS